MPRVKLTSRNLFRIQAEGDDPEDLLFDPGKIMVSETIAMENATKWAWPQILAGVNAVSGTAIRAAVWVLRKRGNPRLKLDEVEFNMGDFTLLDPDEMEEYWVLAKDNDPEEGTIWVGDDAPELPVNTEDDDTEAPKEYSTPPIPEA